MPVDTWHKGNTHDLAWDQVVTYEDGSPIEGEVVNYNLYLKNYQTGVEIFIGPVSPESYQALLPEKGRYLFGVQAAIGVDVSEIMWSDNPVACENGSTFGMRWMNPNWPHNIRHA
jgi:hypothetical protein